MTKSAFNLLGFLRTAITSSVEHLVKSVVDAIAGSKKFDGGVVVKTKAAITVMRQMEMGEALGLFSTLLISLLGEKGLAVPEDIQGMFAPVATAPVAPQVATAASQGTPAPALKPVVLAPKPVPQAPAAASVASLKPVLTAAPARELRAPEQEPSLPDLKKTFLAFLTAISRGDSVPWPAVQKGALNLFKSSVKLALGEWGLLFTAMKMAAEKGKYIVSSDVVWAQAFYKEVPTGMLEDYVFGQDGALVQFMASLHDLRGQMPSWMVAKAHVTLDLINIVDEGLPEGLDKHSLTRVEDLEKLLDSKDAPDSLFEKLWYSWHRKAGGSA